MQVREDDCKPKQVCLTCASKLEMCADLVEMCLAAEFKFDSILHSRFPGLKSVGSNSSSIQVRESKLIWRRCRWIRFVVDHVVQGKFQYFSVKTANSGQACDGVERRHSSGTVLDTVEVKIALWPDHGKVVYISQDDEDCDKAAGVVDGLPVLSMRSTRNWSEELAKGDSAADNTVTVQHDGGVIVLGKVDEESREECQDFVLMVELKYKDPLETSQATYALEPQDGSLGKAGSSIYVSDSEKLQGVTYTSEIHTIAGGKTLTYTIDGEANPSVKSFALSNSVDPLADCQEKTQTLIYTTQPEQLIASKAGEFELATQHQSSLGKTEAASFANNAHTVEYTTVQHEASGGKLQHLLTTYAAVQQATPVVLTRAQILPRTLSEVIEEANIAAKEMVFSAKDDGALEGLEGETLLLNTDNFPPIQCGFSFRQAYSPCFNVGNKVNSSVVRFRSSTAENDQVATNKPKKPFPCSICTKSFMRRTNLNAHMVTHTQVRPHVCEECGKQFCVRWDLTLHQRIHSGLFSCEYCNKAFTVHAKLKRHIRIHTGERPYSCPTCGRAFNDKRNLKTHQQTHTGERPFSCATCSRSFRVRSHLLDHHRVHTQEAPFTCDICGKSFKWKTNLNIHLKTHSGEHFVCSQCGREFTRHSELMKHRRVHTGTRSHVCTICNKNYSERNMLQKHMKLHSDQKPYSCDVCGKSFHYHWYLSSHKKMHTEEKTNNACELCGHEMELLVTVLMLSLTTCFIHPTLLFPPSREMRLVPGDELQDMRPFLQTPKMLVHSENRSTIHSCVPQWNSLSGPPSGDVTPESYVCLTPPPAQRLPLVFITPANEYRVSCPAEFRVRTLLRSSLHFPTMLGTRELTSLNTSSLQFSIALATEDLTSSFLAVFVPEETSETLTRPQHNGDTMGFAAVNPSESRDTPVARRVHQSTLTATSCVQCLSHTCCSVSTDKQSLAVGTLRPPCPSTSSLSRPGIPPQGTGLEAIVTGECCGKVSVELADIPRGFTPTMRHFMDMSVCVLIQKPFSHQGGIREKVKLVLTASGGLQELTYSIIIIMLNQCLSEDLAQAGDTLLDHKHLSQPDRPLKVPTSSFRFVCHANSNSSRKLRVLDSQHTCSTRTPVRDESGQDIQGYVSPRSARTHQDLQEECPQPTCEQELYCTVSAATEHNLCPRRNFPNTANHKILCARCQQRFHYSCLGCAIEPQMTGGLEYRCEDCCTYQTAFCDWITCPEHSTHIVDQRDASPDQEYRSLNPGLATHRNKAHCMAFTAECEQKFRTYEVPENHWVSQAQLKLKGKAFEWWWKCGEFFSEWNRLAQLFTGSGGPHYGILKHRQSEMSDGITSGEHTCATYEKSAKLCYVPNIQIMQDRWGTAVTAPPTETSGYSKHVLMDNGAQFIERMWQAKCTWRGVQHLKMAMYHPRANPTEHRNQYLEVQLLLHVGEVHISWADHLPAALFTLCQCVNAATGRSPSDVLLGQNINVGEQRGKQERYAAGWVRTSNRATPMLELRQIVLMKAHPQSAASQNFCVGLAAWWTGPHHVIKRLGPTTYLVHMKIVQASITKMPYACHPEMSMTMRPVTTKPTAAQHLTSPQSKGERKRVGQHNMQGQAREEMHVPHRISTRDLEAYDSAVEYEHQGRTTSIEGGLVPTQGPPAWGAQGTMSPSTLAPVRAHPMAGATEIDGTTTISSIQKEIRKCNHWLHLWEWVPQETTYKLATGSNVGLHTKTAAVAATMKDRATHTRFITQHTDVSHLWQVTCVRAREYLGDNKNIRNDGSSQQFWNCKCSAVWQGTMQVQSRGSMTMYAWLRTCHTEKVNSRSSLRGVCRITSGLMFRKLGKPSPYWTNHFTVMGTLESWNLFRISAAQDFTAPPTITVLASPGPDKSRCSTQRIIDLNRFFRGASPGLRLGHQPNDTDRRLSSTKYFTALFRIAWRRRKIIACMLQLPKEGFAVPSSRPRTAAMTADSHRETDEILNKILPPRERLEDNQLWRQYVRQVLCNVFF
ncbi:hypothetical protein PR048_007111 [Dryococelus australis]|uniref:C2H2-type domain-containing protein n=1 Tax=Dryococelus australis TaxID=614101 RepID=A0ABQ9ID97_9NEOP|nr:hypothetical protein PR048_007111 [Dryococelus australis]